MVLWYHEYPVKKFRIFYGTKRFITASACVLHQSIYWARSVQSMPPHPTSWRSTLILSLLLRPLPSYKNTYFYSHLPTHCRCRGLLLHLSTQAVIYMLCMTPLEEGSARRRGLYLCNTRHSQETNIHSAAEIRTRNPSERPPCLILLHYVLINRMGYTERGGRVRGLPCLSNFHQN